ncbi:MAG: LysR family transcriptional regulator [Rubritalea sp.]|tara:strand:- start:3998 stop:4900 length:903 start_codon:yes stop_codon:yes gene_type:complete
MLINDIKQIEIFHEFSKSLSFAETSRRVGLTPSAISHSIKSLESQLRCSLVDRNQKPPVITAKGKRFIANTRSVLVGLKYALDDVVTIQGLALPDNLVHIGLERALANLMLVDLIAQFQAGNSKKKFEIHTDQTSVLLEKLKAGKIDLVAGLTPPPISLKGVTHQATFYKEEFKLVTAVDHPSIKSNEFSWKEEKSIISLCFDQYDSHLIKSYFYQLQSDIEVHHHVNSVSAFVELVSKGMGVGISSTLMLSDALKHNKVACQELPGEGLERRWSLYSMSKRPTEQFCELFQSMLISSCD